MEDFLLTTIHLENVLIAILNMGRLERDFESRHFLIERADGKEKRGEELKCVELKSWA